MVEMKKADAKFSKDSSLYYMTFPIDRLLLPKIAPQNNPSNTDNYKKQAS